MEKIPTLFIRGADHKVTDEVHPDCQWVLDGEGIITEKLDGTNVRLTIRKKETVRVEKRKNPSRLQKERGITEPWYADATFEKPEDKHIMGAAYQTIIDWPDGVHCCEAIGPMIQGNTLNLVHPLCFPFDLYPLAIVESAAPITFEDIRRICFETSSRLSPGNKMEGLVFHHPDGRRAKIKRKDF